MPKRLLASTISLMLSLMKMKFFYCFRGPSINYENQIEKKNHHPALPWTYHSQLVTYVG